MRLHSLSLLSFVLVLWSTSQVRAAAVDGFSGKYDLSCERATITARLDVSGGVGPAQTGSQSLPLSIELSCNKDDPAFLAALAKLSADLESSCERITLGRYEGCADAASDYAQAIYDLNAALIDLTPRYADLRVLNSSDWANILFNLYPFYGTVTNGRGESQLTQFMINRYGNFAAGGINVYNGQGVGNDQAGIGCIAWATAAVDGAISAANGYSVSARYALNANLTCGAASQSSAWFLANINLGVSGAVSGKKR